VEDSLTKVVIIPMEGCVEKALQIASELRENEINTQVYAEKGKMGKKFGYVDKGNIPYTLIIGEEEIEQKKYTLRDMKTGEQNMLSIKEIIEKLLDK